MDFREPTEVAAGDTITWTRVLPDYPASVGWELKYAMRGPAVVNLVSNADGDDHLVEITPDELTVSGTYYVQGYVELDGARHTVFTGRIKVNPNLVDAAAGYDGRSHAEKVIAAIEANIEGAASKAQQEMWIDGDKLANKPFAELMSLRNRYRHELASEVRREKRRNGRRVSRSVPISF